MIEKLAQWLARHDPSLKGIETTAEAKSILPILYKKWFNRLHRLKLI